MIGEVKLKADFIELHNQEDNRYSHTIESYGPVAEGTKMDSRLHKWTATLEGTTATVVPPSGIIPNYEDGNGDEVTYPVSPDLVYTVPEGTYRFHFTFDINGNINYVYAVDGTVHLFYYDADTRDHIETTFQGQWPCLAIDGLDPEAPYDIDVVLAYTTLEESPRLITRFQRQRFEQENDNGTLHGVNPHLRTIGLAPNGRFLFRFKSPITIS